MLRSKYSELVIHGFQTSGVELRFEAKMPQSTLELEGCKLGVGQQGGKEMGRLGGGRFWGDAPIDAVCLSDLWYSSTLPLFW